METGVGIYYPWRVDSFKPIILLPPPRPIPPVPGDPRVRDTDYSVGDVVGH